jgi:general stress protein 26
MRLSKSVMKFFKDQNFVVIATLDDAGFPHISCKGIVKVEEDRIYLLDLYKLGTFHNLRRRKKVSITAVDPDTFKGYSIKGYGKIVDINKAHQELLDIWEERIVKRISHRVISHLRKEKSSIYHPEAVMPYPQYIIIVEVKEVVNLVPKPIQD